MKNATPILLLLCALFWPYVAASNPPTERCCITEAFPYLLDKNPDTIRKRLDLYRSIGCDILRLHAYADDVNPAEVYYGIVKEYPFRIKMILMDLPYDLRYQLMDQNGVRSKLAVNYWYPGIRDIVEGRLIKIAQRLRDSRLMDRIDYVIPFLGPAGESLYPHLWATGLPEPTFWCYDPHAQQDFRAKMKERYGDIAKANAAWKTEFTSWEDARVLPPETKPGKYWDNVLTWYRDTKREFARWSVETVQKHFAKRVILYLPGSHVSWKQWEDAVNTANGDVWVKTMVDNEFLMDLAHEKDCWVQYTGVDNATEAAYLAQYLDKYQYRSVKIWGENAGVQSCANDPEGLARTVVENGYYGLDYTASDFLFAPDGVTPAELLAKLGEAFRKCKMISVETQK